MRDTDAKAGSQGQSDKDQGACLSPGSATRGSTAEKSEKAKAKGKSKAAVDISMQCDCCKHMNLVSGWPTHKNAARKEGWLWLCPGCVSKQGWGLADLRQKVSVWWDVDNRFYSGVAHWIISINYSSAFCG